MKIKTYFNLNISEKYGDRKVIKETKLCYIYISLLILLIMEKRPVIFFDLETTGNMSNHVRIIELSAKKVDIDTLEIVDSLYYKLNNDGIPIEKEAFEECKHLVINASKNSCAIKYAKQHKIPFKII